jgi:dUTP pyrophosphatase
MTPALPIARLPHAEGLPLPAYETAGSSGLDLRAAVPQGEPIVMPPGGRTAVPTGLCFGIPAGFEGQVRSRSGLAVRHGVTCLTGTIDSDYRGEIKVVLINLGQEDFVINRGDRVAQMIIAPFAQARISEVDSLDETSRGAGGFGSTGR